MQVSPQDAIWSVHKHTKLRSDVTLIYPVGAGGQWLMTQINRGAQHDPLVNEYRAEQTWMGWETLLQGFTDQGEALIDCDDLTATLGIWSRYVASNPAKHRHTAAHHWPWLTAQAFDYRTRQLLEVSCSPDMDWFIGCLAWSKLYCSLPNTSYKITNLLNHAQRRLPRAYSDREYNLTMRLLRSCYPGEDIYGTTASYLYFIDCLHYEHDPCDPQHFKTWVLGHVSLQQGLVRHAPLYRWHDIMRRRVSPCCDSVTEIDYGRLFIDLDCQLELGGQPLDVAALAQYTEANLAVVQRLCHMAPSDTSGDWLERLRGLRQRFARAKLQHAL
jgi:hypothetical protein